MCLSEKKSLKLLALMFSDAFLAQSRMMGPAKLQKSVQPGSASAVKKKMSDLPI